jgi:two-component system cell cycle response regulator
VPTVLIVDDSAAHRTQLREVLREAGLFRRILEAADGIAGLKRMLSEPLDLVICDVEMPGLQGDKLVRMSKNARGRSVPFLMLTAVPDDERVSRLLRQGARDVICKPFQPLELIARIELHLELARLQDELEAQNRLLERISSTDALTGLANRRAFDQALAMESKRSERHAQHLSLLLFDVDHFKQVNDRHGHLVGDHVLQELGRILRDRLRVTDTAARFGGEEFAVIVAAPPEGALVAAERWRQDIEGQAIPDGKGGSFRISVSVGVATRGDICPDAGALLAAADDALYRAKEGGRNQVVLHASSGGDDGLR